MAGISCLVPELRDAAFSLDDLVARSGLVGKFTSTCRSRAEQERLYRAYISGRHAFPVAPPGSSAHEYGEAFDYVVSPYEYQGDVGATWQSWGGTWGGARDAVHFELPGASERARANGQNLIQELAQKYADLPWWATIALPISSTVETTTPEEQEKFSHPLQFLCKTYGIFC